MPVLYKQIHVYLNEMFRLLEGGGKSSSYELDCRSMGFMFDPCADWDTLGLMRAISANEVNRNCF